MFRSMVKGQSKDSAERPKPRSTSKLRGITSHSASHNLTQEQLGELGGIKIRAKNMS